MNKISKTITIFCALLISSIAMADVLWDGVADIPARSSSTQPGFYRTCQDFKIDTNTSCVKTGKINDVELTLQDLCDKYFAFRYGEGVKVECVAVLPQVMFHATPTSRILILRDT